MRIIKYVGSIKLTRRNIEECACSAYLKALHENRNMPKEKRRARAEGAFNRIMGQCMRAMYWQKQGFHLGQIWEQCAFRPSY